MQHFYQLNKSHQHTTRVCSLCVDELRQKKKPTSLRDEKDKDGTGTADCSVGFDKLHI